MNDFELSKAERIILATQHEILAKLDKENEEEHLRFAEQLRQGHKWLYQQRLKQTVQPDLLDNDANFVVRILGIYSDMRDSYAALSDKAGISEFDITFPGFDGNDSEEATYLNFAEGLRVDGRFANTLSQGRALHTGSPQVNNYHRIIGKWQQMGGPTYPLTAEQIKELLSARRSYAKL